MKKLQVKIYRKNKDINLPHYVPETAACFDLEAAEGTTIAPGTIGKVPTGLIVKVPEGYALAVVPRSSSIKLGISMPHSIGIVDPLYCGRKDELLVILKNNNNTEFVIKKGERIAQAMFIELPRVVWQEIAENELEAVDRGGFGSTGK